MGSWGEIAESMIGLLDSFFNGLASNEFDASNKERTKIVCTQILDSVVFSDDLIRNLGGIVAENFEVLCDLAKQIREDLEHADRLICSIQDDVATMRNLLSKLRDAGVEVEIEPFSHVLGHAPLSHLQRSYANLNDTLPAALRSPPTFAKSGIVDKAKGMDEPSSQGRSMDQGLSSGESLLIKGAENKNIYGVSKPNADVPHARSTENKNIPQEFRSSEVNLSSSGNQKHASHEHDVGAEGRAKDSPQGGHTTTSTQPSTMDLRDMLNS